MQMNFVLRPLSFALAAAAAAAAANTTGFFHIERIDGRDWAVAPDGRPTVLAGVDWVWPSGFFCEELALDGGGNAAVIKCGFAA